jgi:pimeloyl-ACP methyl ester carboxylesterase
MSFLDLWPKSLDDTQVNNDHSLPPMIEIDLGKPFDDQIPKEDTRYYVPGKYSHELYLIGHSMGGLVASEFARAHRHMVTKVVLFNAAGLPVDIQLKNLLPFVLHHFVWLLRKTDLLDAPVHALGKALTYVGTRFNFTFDDLCYYGDNLDEEIAEEQTKLKSGPLAIIAQNVPRTLLGPTTNTILSNYRFAKAFHFLLATWLHQLTIEQRSTVLLSISKHFPLLDADHSGALRELDKTPVLVVWGEEDGLLPCSNLGKFQQYLPHAQVLSIPASDHAAFMQKPTLIFDAMMKFFAEREDCQPANVF